MNGGSDADGANGAFRRRQSLRELLESDRVVRIVGVSDGFTALIARRHGFDALWASGLGVSAAHGVPDASIATLTDFLGAAQTIDRAAELPVVADCDTGFGDINVIAHMVRAYERAGIAAVCIEDKLFPKRNSFAEGQVLEDAHAFAAKVAAAVAVRSSPEFLIFARLESFVAGFGPEEAIRRARLYADAGADALVIHSKEPDPGEVEAFAHAWRSAGHELPIVVIPTTYPTVTVAELRDLEINGVIYANHALRAAMRAIDRVLGRVAADGTTANVEGEIASVGEVLQLLGTDEIARRDSWFQAEIDRLRALERVEALPG